MTGIIINGTLVLFGAAMIYMLLWRVLFFDTNREPDPTDIEAFVARCKRGGSLEARGRFGAMRQYFDEAGGDPKALRMSLERFRRRVERFHDAISVVANGAIEIGLLGTVVSLILTGGGKDVATVIIGLGMMSTMYGLIIGIPGKMFHGLTDKRVMRFLDYTDALLEALDGRINQSASLAFAPSSGNGSGGNGRPHKRLLDIQSANGRHRSQTSGQAQLTESLETTASKPLSPARDTAGSTTTPERAVDHILLDEVDFNERVVDWIGTKGDVQNETTT